MLTVNNDKIKTKMYTTYMFIYLIANTNKIHLAWQHLSCRISVNVITIKYQIKTSTVIQNKQPMDWHSGSCNMPIHVHFLASDFDPKVGHTDLVFGHVTFGEWSEFISGSAHARLCAVVMICATLVNIQRHTQTHRQHFDQFIWIDEPAKLIKMHTGQRLTE